MIGFPKNSTELLTIIKDRQDRGRLSSHPDLISLFEKQAHRYDSIGLPVKQTEGWRHFPIHKLTKEDYFFSDQITENKTPNKPSRTVPDSFLISIKNGQPHFEKPPVGIHLFQWKDFLDGTISLDPKIEKEIYNCLNKERNGFCHLNNILSLNGLILVIDKSLKNPIEIQYLYDSIKEKEGSHLRSFIFVKESCSAQILETFHVHQSDTKSRFFFNLQTDFILEKNSKLNHVRLDQGTNENVQMNQLFSSLGVGANGVFSVFNLKSGLSWYLTDVSQDKKSNAEIRGFSSLGDNQHSHHQVSVNHHQESTSNQFYRALLFDSAQHVFNGKIIIDQQAQKTSAHQLNKNLLFGKRAFAVSCPELDIEADDVVAMHGATISSLEEQKEMIFYLQSRGLSLKESHHLILSGILQESLSFIDQKISPHLESLVWKRLSQLQGL